jgi:hypothetical protein
MGEASKGGGEGSGVSRGEHVCLLGEEGTWMAGTQLLLSGDDGVGDLSKLVTMVGLAALRMELLRSRILAMAAFRNEPFLCRPLWLWRSAFAMADSLIVPWSSCPCVPSLPLGAAADVPGTFFDDALRKPASMPPDLLRLWPDALSGPGFTSRASALSSICFPRLFPASLVFLLSLSFFLLRASTAAAPCWLSKCHVTVWAVSKVNGSAS